MHLLSFGFRLHPPDGEIIACALSGEIIQSEITCPLFILTYLGKVKKEKLLVIHV